MLRLRAFFAAGLIITLSWTHEAIGDPLIKKTFTLEFDGLKSPRHCLISHPKLARPKIGLVLSGGGLRGLAQIGILKVLEENNIPLDYIVGTSIGSVIGGLYASGYSPDEIWQITRSIKWAELLNDAPQRSAQFLGEKQKRNRAILQFRLQGLHFYLPESFTPGQSLMDILTNLTLNAPYHSLEFDHLRVPLRIITTDILSGKKVVLKNGDLAEAMRASIAIPLLFSPIEKDSAWLADGGLTDNIPVEEAKALGADFVLVANTTSLLRSKDDLQAPWEVADQVTTIMQQRRNQEQLALADLVIGFEDVSFSSTDAAQLDWLFEEGQKRALDKIERIQSLTSAVAAPPDHPVSYWIDRVLINASKDVDFSKLIDTWASRRVSELEIMSSLKRAYSIGSLCAVQAEIISDNSDTLLTYNLTPNPPLNSISFKGNTLFADSLLQAFFSPMLGKSINCKEAETAIENIIKLYRSSGYSLAEIAGVRYSEMNRSAEIELSEGNIASITFKGNERTRNFVIERDFGLKKGGHFQFDNASQAVKNVFGTGLFSSVFLTTVPGPEGWHIILDLHEKPSTVLRLGARYDQERKARSFIEASDENVFGSGNDITLHTQYGIRDAAAILDIRADRIFKTYLTSQMSLHLQNSKYFYYSMLKGLGEYERRANGAVFRLGQQIARFGTVSAVMRIEKINIRSISGSGYDPGSLKVRTLGFNSEVDTRDQVPFPRSGKFYKFFYEVSSGNFLAADISYFKVQSQLATYLTFLSRNTFCPRLIWGTSDMTTPFSEQFRIGGEQSFYGLREGELQGRHMMLFNFEYRYFLPAKWPFDFYLSLRYDFGAVWQTVVDVKPEDFINGKGISLAFKSPLGPVSFSYGASVNGRRRFYLSAGYDF